MESEVALVGCLVFARRPDEAHEIVVSALFVLRYDKEDGGDDCSDIDQVGVVSLAVFNPEVFACRFEEHG